MKRVLTVTMPLPSRTLSPNGRAHFHRKAKAVKKYREDACLAAMSQGTRSLKLKQATVQCHFTFPNARRRDSDNLLASMKSAFDGLVDAGVFVDDNELTHLPVTKSVDKNDPRVEIRIYTD